MNTTPPSSRFYEKPMNQTIKQKVTTYWDKMGRLNLLTGVMGAEKLKREADQHLKNREAEEAHVRKNVWGSEESEQSTSDESMRDTVLGDIHHPTPIIMPQQSSAWPIIAGLALASLLPTAAIAGLAGYFFSRPDVNIESPEFDDESVSVGLGRIDDYLNENTNEQ